MPTALAYLKLYGKPQGYESWPDALWRIVGGTAMLKRLNQWMLRQGWRIPYGLQPGYGMRYEGWYQRMRLRLWWQTRHKQRVM